MALKHTSQVKTPDFNMVKDEATRRAFLEIVRLVYDSFKNIYEDLKNTENILPDPSGGDAEDELRVNAAKTAYELFTSILVPDPSGGDAEDQLQVNAGKDGYELFTPSAAGVNVKVGTLTREMDAASGNVGYTGVGFKPKLILCHYGENNTAEIYTGLGFDDDTTARGIGVLNAAGAINSMSYCVVAHEDASKFQLATVASFDSDGFTLTWTKGSTPASETLIVDYIAIG